ncbi:hypothetical protein N478_14410 [Pseudoalteromonas luteoviolacea S4060-1]|uniref:Uncharacterized protein n=1 Tax=Pseudoalteromonas luteoviolacea S4060-1 TaxID=1365257 RepID=A0A167NJ20_9GAMM|nr:hypothetical protein N478_14410 [Pseudoalteromonas luteoviolacea S4060-1]
MKQPQQRFELFFAFFSSVLTIFMVLIFVITNKFIDYRFFVNIFGGRLNVKLARQLFNCSVLRILALHLRTVIRSMG